PISIATRRNLPVRGFLTIEGTMIKPDQVSRLRSGAIKRRIFDVETGLELDLSRDRIRIGDRLAVVIEGTEAALPDSKPGDQPDSKPDDNPDDQAASGPDALSKPALVVDLPPSAFQLLSTDLFGQREIPRRDKLAALTPLGDLRSVQSSPDRWIAVVSPQ